MHTHVEARALRFKVWLGQGEAPSMSVRSDLMGRRDISSSPIRSRPSSPQDQCMQELFQKTSVLFKALAYVKSDQSSSFIKSELSEIIKLIRCARRDPLFLEPLTFLATQLSLLFFSITTTSTNFLLSFLSSVTYIQTYFQHHFLSMRRQNDLLMN